MTRQMSQSDRLEEPLIEFAARIVEFTSQFQRRPQDDTLRLMRSGTAAAPNYAEARGAESCADFIHKLRIVEKELNETSVWLRILLRINREKQELLAAILQENLELAKIITASIRTRRRGILKNDR